MPCHNHEPTSTPDSVRRHLNYYKALLEVVGEKGEDHPEIFELYVDYVELRVTNSGYAADNAIAEDMCRILTEKEEFVFGNLNVLTCDKILLDLLSWWREHKEYDLERRERIKGDLYCYGSIY